MGFWDSLPAEAGLSFGNSAEFWLNAPRAFDLWDAQNSHGRIQMVLQLDRYDKIFDRSFNRCYQSYYKKTV